MFAVDLIYNLSILVALSVISGFISKRWSRFTRKGELLQGGLFGIASILAMMHPLEFSQGIIFDGRSIMVSLCGLFFGPWAVAIAAVIAGAYRISQGGAGTFTGILIILFSAITGLLFYYQSRRHANMLRARYLLGFGVLVHAGMLGIIFTLPLDTATHVLREIGLTVILFYPIATVLIGKILSDQNAYNRYITDLQQSEQRYRTLVENLPGIVYRSAPQSPRPTHYISDSVLEITGAPAADFLSGKVLWTHLIVPEDQARVTQAVIAAIAHHTPLNVEYRIQSLDQGIRWVIDTAQCIYSPNGSPDYLDGVIFDVTHHKQLEAVEDRHSKQLDTLYEAGRRLNESLDLQTIYRAISSFLSSLMAIDGLIISRYDSEKQLIYYAAYLSKQGWQDTSDLAPVPLEPAEEDPRTEEDFRNQEIQSDAAPVVIRTGKSLLLHNYRVHILKNHSRSLSHAPARKLIKETPEDVEVMRSAMIVPLKLDGKVTGVIQVLNHKTNAYTEDHLRLLESLSLYIASASQNALLYQKAQDELRERERVEAALRESEGRYRHSNAELRKAYEATIEGWSRALDLRDHETEGHSRRVTDLSHQMAKEMGLSEEEQTQVKRGALLHDIGKMGVPDPILLKPGKLSPDEWNIMKRHPQYAYDLLYPIEFLRPALDIPYHHHEKWDGSGYPHGMAGENIPLAARIFAVVDVWDAITSDRPYRLAWPREKALEYIQDQAGKHFDPMVVHTFTMVVSRQDETSEAGPYP